MQSKNFDNEGSREKYYIQCCLCCFTSRIGRFFRGKFQNLCNKNPASDFLCWLVKTSFASVIGFFAIGITLALLSTISPSLYNFLTRWANAPSLPAIVSCSVKKILTPPAPELSGYEVEISVKNQNDGIYDLIIMANGPNISIYELGTSNKIYNEDKNFVSRRFISSSRSRSKSFNFDVSIDHYDQGTPPFTIGSVELVECPLEIFPIRRKI